MRTGPRTRKTSLILWPAAHNSTCSDLRDRCSVARSVPATAIRRSTPKRFRTSTKPKEFPTTPMLPTSEVLQAYSSSAAHISQKPPEAAMSLAKAITGTLCLAALLRMYVDMSSHCAGAPPVHPDHSLDKIGNRTG